MNSADILYGKCCSRWSGLRCSARCRISCVLLELHFTRQMESITSHSWLVPFIGWADFDRWVTYCRIPSLWSCLTVFIWSVQLSFWSMTPQVINGEGLSAGNAAEYQEALLRFSLVEDGIWVTRECYWPLIIPSQSVVQTQTVSVSEELWMVLTTVRSSVTIPTSNLMLERSSIKLCAWCLGAMGSFSAFWFKLLRSHFCGWIPPRFSSAPCCVTVFTLQWLKVIYQTLTDPILNKNIKYRKHSTDQAASIERATEFTFQVDGLSLELEYFTE